MDDVTRWKESGRDARLWQRQEIVSAIRDYLYGEQFLEVETPLLVKTTCPDTWIDTVEVGDGYLVTSTEYQIKRMMVGGFDKVFTLCKNFRAGDRGSIHSAEFTMLEWARANESLSRIEEDAVQFTRKAFKRLYPEKTSLEFRGHEIDFLVKEWEVLTVREAFRIHLGLKDVGDFSLNALLRAAKEAGLELPPNFDTPHLVTSYILDLLQTHLGKKTPTFLREWPSFMTTSAPINSLDPYTAERSELYIGGVEISNGFPFLQDADLQKKLFLAELEKRKKEGKTPVKIDERFVEALALGLPKGAGMALGVDRLVMILTGANQLKEVQAFDWDEL